MELKRLALLGVFLAVFWAWWAHGAVTTKNTDSIGVDLEGAVVPVQYQQHYQMNLPHEMHCPPCPPCPPCPTLPPPRRMGPSPRRSRKHHHNKHRLPRALPGNMDHPPASAPSSPENKDHPPASAPASPGNKDHLPSAPASPGKNSTNTTQPESPYKEMAMKVVRFSGDVLTTTSVPIPFVIYWTTGNLESTIRFYAKLTLGSSALSSYGWLMYSILQVSYKDKVQVIGVDAIVVNAISWSTLAFMFMVLLMWEGPNRRGKLCITGMVAHVAFSIVLLQFPILRLVESNGSAKFVVGVIAALLQGSSEIFPLIHLWKTWDHVYPLLGHPQGPPIRNYKKMTIVSRAIDLIITLYWLQYCISTYEFDEFGIANITSAALSLISFVAHSAWALKPNH